MEEYRNYEILFFDVKRRGILEYLCLSKLLLKIFYFYVYFSILVGMVYNIVNLRLRI